MIIIDDFYDKISQVKKSTKKHQKALKSTTKLRFIDLKFIDTRFIEFDISLLTLKNM